MKKIDSLVQLDVFNNEIQSATNGIRLYPRKVGFIDYIFKKRQLWEEVVKSNNNIMQSLPEEVECSADVFLVYMQFHANARGEELKNIETWKRSGLATLGKAAVGLYKNDIVALLTAGKSYLSFVDSSLKDIKRDVWRGEMGFYDNMFGAYKIDYVGKPIVLSRASWELDTYEIPTSRMPSITPFVRTNGGPSRDVLSQFIAA